MILNVISDYKLWEKQGLALEGEVINLPASIPAFLALEKDRKPFITTSFLLSKEDYQDTWQQTLLLVWDMVQASFKDEDSTEPNVILIHAYSLYLLISQIRILEKVFDACCLKYNITEIRFEDPDGFKCGEYIFWHDLDPAYYHEVARSWSAHKSMEFLIIKRDMHDEGATHDFYIKKHILGMVAFIFKLFKYIRERCFDPVVSAIKNISYILCGRRRILFYSPFPGAGLGYSSPGFAINIDCLIHLSLVFERSSVRGHSSASYTGDKTTDLVMPFVEKEVGACGCILRERFSRYLKWKYEKGRYVFHFLLRFLKVMQKLNFQTAFVASSIFVDFISYQGYVADAFRKSRQKVAGVTHGGNARLMKRAATPFLIVDYVADIFFLWGDASSDEHAEYGIDRSPVFVKTGFPRKGEFLKARDRGKSPFKNTGQPRIIYAPTALSVQTTIGNNVVWDAYINTLRKVFEILNAAQIDCVVKLLRSSEMDCVDLSLYPNIKFLRAGMFSDYMWKADYIITDSLGGSPIYEAVHTDRPILFYTGSENQAWDGDFLEKLTKRAICFFDSESYIKGLMEFVVNPEKYVSSSGIKISDDLVNEYMPGVSVHEFWRTIHDSCFDIKTKASTLRG